MGLDLSKVAANAAGVTKKLQAAGTSTIDTKTISKAVEGGTEKLTSALDGLAASASYGVKKSLPNDKTLAHAKEASKMTREEAGTEMLYDVFGEFLNECEKRGDMPNVKLFPD